MKLNVFLTSLFLSTAILGVSSQAMIQDDEGDFTRLSQCLNQFHGVNRQTLPILLHEVTANNNLESAKKIGRFYNAVQALNGHGYVNRGDKRDKAISGVKKFFEDNKKETDTILQSLTLIHNNNVNSPATDYPKLFKFESRNDCFAVFKDVGRGTFAQLKGEAEKGSLESLKRLKEFDDVLVALKELKYTPQQKLSGLDMKIKGIQESFEKDRKVIDKLYADKKDDLFAAPKRLSLQGHETFPSTHAHQRVKIFEINQQVSKEGYDFNGKPIKIDTASSINGTRIYGNVDDAYKPKVRKGNFQTKFFVRNADTVDYAIGMILRGQKPLVIDMANASRICGAASNGHGDVQEERIAYRSNLYAPLYDVSTKVTKGKAKNFIPKEGGVYVPGVTIFRHGEDKGYAFMEQPIQLDIGAIAAYRHKARIKDSKQADEQIYSDLQDEKEYWASTKRKVYAYFDMAIDQGHDTLLLSAFGCGAFKNPPKEMVQVFEEALNDYEGCFKEVHFAILSKDEQNDPNFVRFKKAFDGKVYEAPSNPDEYVNNNNKNVSINKQEAEIEKKVVKLDGDNWGRYSKELNPTLSESLKFQEERVIDAQNLCYEVDTAENKKRAEQEVNIFNTLLEKASDFLNQNKN